MLTDVQALIRVHSAGAAHYCGDITRFLIRVFPLHANDMHLSSTIQSLFTTMSKQAACIPGMAREGVPPLLEILNNSNSHLSSLVEGALDLLCTFVSDNLGARTA